ncbi:MAG: hypothetical protein ABWX94_00360 [Candidatus Saccharimonadales bacterium]
MGRFKETVAVAALAAGVAFSGSGCGAEGAHALAEDKLLMETSFNEAKEFWLAQGLGKASATKLIILEGSDSFDCLVTDSEPTYSDDTAVSVCDKPDTTMLVVPAGRLNKLRALDKQAELSTNEELKGLPNGAIRGSAHYWAGRIVQTEATGILANISSDPDRAKEQSAAQAVCLAGVSVRHSPNAAVVTRDIQLGFAHVSPMEGDPKLPYSIGYESTAPPREACLIAPGQ